MGYVLWIWRGNNIEESLCIVGVDMLREKVFRRKIEPRSNLTEVMSLAIRPFIFYASFHCRARVIPLVN